MAKNNREYLIFEDWLNDRSLTSVFDACAEAVLDGTACVEQTKYKPDYSQYPCFRAEGREVMVRAVFDYYLYKLGIEGFDYEKARDFSERMRRLAGFSYEVRYTLEQWVERCLRNPYFHNIGDNRFNQNWVLKPDEAHDFIPEDFSKFACYIAICHMKYGASYSSVTANRIFGFVTTLGSDLPAKLKKNGSGTLPREVTEYKDAALSCKANDAFATIKITMKEDAEEHYARALDFLCSLLETDFPHSYSIAFRGPAKPVLPIKGLPKCGVHYLFAGAVAYQSLYERIERYARLAMREYEWYTDLEDEKCAMPGTFAVFALAMANPEKYHALACDYLKTCDDEHQSIQGDFVLACIEKYGFTERGPELYSLLEDAIQWVPKKLTALYKKFNEQK